MASYVPMILLLFCVIFAQASTESTYCEDVVCKDEDSNNKVHCPDDSSLQRKPLVINFSVTDGVHDRNQPSQRNRRSLRPYSRHESIIIVPGEYNHKLHKRHVIKQQNERVAALVDDSIKNTAWDDDIKHEAMCCAKKCMCTGNCPLAKCHPDQMVVVIKNGTDEPGHCCPHHKCVDAPDCTLKQDGYRWHQVCKTCSCQDGKPFCHDTCPDRHERMCYSDVHSRSYVHTEQWQEDDCKRCECIEGQRICQQSVCKPLHCEKKLYVSGECCPICDVNGTQFCSGHEHCGRVCPQNYPFEYDSENKCNLCECSARVPDVKPDPQPPIKWIFIIPMIVVCLAIILASFFAFRWWYRRHNQSYKTVSSHSSDQAVPNSTI